MKKMKSVGVLPGFGLTMGFTLTYLSLIVLIPLAALISKVHHPDLGPIPLGSNRPPRHGLL